MRKEVYVKFAEAVGRQRAQARAEAVHVKFAAALEAVRTEKRAANAKTLLIRKGLGHALNALRGGKALPLAKGQLPALNPGLKDSVKRTATAVQAAISPKIRMKGDLDPMRLLTKTRTQMSPVTMDEAMESAHALQVLKPGQAAKPTDILNQMRLGQTTETHRLDPKKVLAALGLAGATAGAAAVVPRPTLKDALKNLRLR